MNDERHNNERKKKIRPLKANKKQGLEGSKAKVEKGKLLTIHIKAMLRENLSEFFFFQIFIILQRFSKKFFNHPKSKGKENDDKIIYFLGGN